MLHQLKILVGLLVCVAICSGCWKAPNPVEAKKQLIGNWELKNKRECDGYERAVISDHIRLFADGRFEQRTKTAETSEVVTNGVWSYQPPRHVSFDKRRHVRADLSPELRGEILIVEFSSPPVILLDPDSNCFYERIGN